MATNQSKLESIFNHSLPGNHLLQISIVKQDVQEANYKKQYFCFLTLAPSEQSQSGGKTYNFQNRITLKVEGYKLNSLAFHIERTVNGTENSKFSLYTDPSKSGYGGNSPGKAVYIMKGNSQKSGDYITLNFKVGANNAIAYVMNPCDALSLAHDLHLIYNKLFDLEFSRGVIASPIQNNNFGSNQPQGIAGQPNSQSPQGFNNNSFDQTNQNVMNDFGSALDDLPF